MTAQKPNNVLQNEVLSVVCHQFRTTLTILYSVIQNLRDEFDKPLTAHQTEMLDIADRNIDRVSRLIGRLFELSRLKSGTVLLKTAPVDLPLLIRNILSGLETQSRAKRISFKAKIHDGMPPIDADADLLSEVLLNLLDNAIRYAEKEIEIEAQVLLRYIWIVVRDDGPGIAPGNPAGFFDHCGRLWAHPAVIGEAGLGLGLTLCQEIIDLHHGKIWMEPACKTGTEIRLLLPIDLASHRAVPEALQDN